MLEREPVEAYAVLEGTIQVMADLARGADLALRIGACEAMPPLDADARLRWQRVPFWRCCLVF